MMLDQFQKEAGMSHIDLHLANLQRLVERLRDRWRQRGELAALDRTELDRLAADLGMTSRDVEHLVELGPDSAELLYRRLAALGMTRAEVERIAPGLARDLERTCACCDHKHVCEVDLSSRPDATDWHDYCPNAIALESAKICRGRFPA
jgi:uncharacterized protein YjiS (DUF1127 family)